MTVKIVSTTRCCEHIRVLGQVMTTEGRSVYVREETAKREVKEERCKKENMATQSKLEKTLTQTRNSGVPGGFKLGC